MYEQVVDDITTSIRNGTLRPGDKLPTIADLAHQYKSSDNPIKRALWILDERGWIEVHQGKGSFVADKPPT
ncbi:winged helix-turn-helix domain-containing protein [Micromonospora sp. WMMD882]|uniref:winged helix-turn-helix domain-containing protein n=1 Tax=Micromonospora sp. WMMD882 TaxID=3015151 RepID=UPI00248C88FF|nr:winged helix-turn-helix domain-containing protein [Micromonospora sp. WMMD882]WBB81599.1 winged helix-turn-helix domain-containing protein [Micromonospora sp. WMMD882]